MDLPNPLAAFLASGTTVPVSCSLPWTNVSAFAVYHRGVYAQKKEMLPDLPLDSVSWERRKDTFTSQLPLLAGLPGNVVLMEDSPQLCAGQGVML